MSELGLCLCLLECCKIRGQKRIYLKYQPAKRTNSQHKQERWMVGMRTVQDSSGLCVLHSPLASRAIVLVTIPLENASNFMNKWIFWIRIAQERANGEKNLQFNMRCHARRKPLKSSTRDSIDSSEYRDRSPHFQLYWDEIFWL